MSGNETITVAAAQLAEVYMDRAATIKKDCEYIHRAGDEGIDLLVFPEFHVAGSPQFYRFIDSPDFEEFYEELFDNAVTVPGPSIDRICKAAKQAGTVVVLGVNEKLPETAGTIYNSQVFIDADGSLLGVRRKLVPTRHERLFHAGGTGEGLRVFESRLGKIGGLICGEHTNHLAGYTILAQGEEIHAAAWPAFPWMDRETRERRIGIRTRFHAFAGGVPTISASGVITDELADALNKPDWGGGGTSAIISPRGEYLAGPKREGEGFVSAEVDLSDRTRRKATHDITGHYNRFDIFDLTVDRSPRTPVSFKDDR